MAFVLTIGISQLTENPDRGLDHLERHDHKTGRVHGCRGAEAPKEAKNLQGGAQLECHLHPDESLLLKTKMTGTQPRQKNKPSCRSGHVFNQAEIGNAGAA